MTDLDSVTSQDATSQDATSQDATSQDATHQDLLDRFDLFDGDQEDHKVAVMAHARRNCPVARTAVEGQWLVTRYADARRVLLDPEGFSSSGVTPKPSPVPMPPLDTDPPLHQQYRKILNPYFSRGYLLKFEAQMRELASELIAPWLGTGRCELVADYITPFTAGVLARIVFEEPDPSRTASAVAAVIRNATENTPESFHEVARCAAELLANRRAEGVVGEGVLAALSTASIDGERGLTIEEQVSVVMVLFLAGLDTTRGGIGLIVEQLIQDAGLERRFRGEGWERRDIDEYVRLVSPVKCLGRRATRDALLGDVRIRAGDHVLVHFDSANHDAEEFADPDALRFDRSRPHAGFGLGIHRCLGAQLARIQIQVALDELLRRTTNIGLTPGARPRHIAGITNGVETLPITFDQVAR